MTNTQEHATWGELLHSAVHTPGKLLAAYTAFHNYSFGNALLALEQCISRKIEPGPLNSYKGWLDAQTASAQGRKGPLPLHAREVQKARSERCTAEGEESEEVTRSTLRVSRLLVCLGANGRRGDGHLPIPGFDLDTALIR